MIPVLLASLCLGAPALADELLPSESIVLHGEPEAPAAEPVAVEPPVPVLPPQPVPEGVAAYLDAVPRAPEGCHVRANNAHVIIDCAGTALLVAEGDGTRAGLLELVDEQVAPFASAGLPVTEAAEVSCQLQGLKARCVERTVSVPGADSMSVLGGLAPDGSFAAVCLRRGPGVGDPCATVVTGGG